MKFTVVPGRWIHPSIGLSRDFGSYFYRNGNKVRIGHENGHENFIIKALIHELNHWAHFHELTRREHDRVCDYRNKLEYNQGVSHYETPLETLAWYGTEVEYSALDGCLVDYEHTAHPQVPGIGRFDEDYWMDKDEDDD